MIKFNSGKCPSLQILLKVAFQAVTGKGGKDEDSKSFSMPSLDFGDRYSLLRGICHSWLSVQRIKALTTEKPIWEGIRSVYLSTFCSILCAASLRACLDREVGQRANRKFPEEYGCTLEIQLEKFETVRYLAKQKGGWAWLPMLDTNICAVQVWLML